jgi:hypothetical protein
MHPTLEPYVDTPSLINWRFIAVGVLSGVSMMLVAVAVMRYVDHQRACERAEQRYAARDQAAAERMVARTLVRELAFNAWPAWVAANPDRPCPDRLDDLGPYIGLTTVRDPWSSAFMFHCDGVHFVVASAGPDGVLSNDDDIRSDR